MKCKLSYMNLCSDKNKKNEIVIFSSSFDEIMAREEQFIFLSSFTFSPYSIRETPVDNFFTSFKLCFGDTETLHV